MTSYISHVMQSLIIVTNYNYATVPKIMTVFFHLSKITGLSIRTGTLGSFSTRDLELKRFSQNKSYKAD